VYIRDWGGDWRPCLPGYALHVVRMLSRHPIMAFMNTHHHRNGVLLQLAAVCEWIMAICLIAFFATYYPDFARIHFEVRIVSLLTSASTRSVAASADPAPVDPEPIHVTSMT
jgi:hypothetical protein